MKVDTIAAIATSLSDSGIGIIRVSGEESISICDKIFITKGGNRKLKTYESHTVHYGFIIDSDDKIIDEVMVTVFKSPRSYTTENTVEISCHGGIVVMKKILKIVIDNGARLSEPGEFTKRAFLNGRIDLSKAEAVMDVINSQNEISLNSSMRQLRGDLYKLIKSLREKIIYEIAFIESAIDDPEHIDITGYSEKLYETVDNLLSEIKKLIDSSENGRIIKNGISTVIVGKPNAGKSSLLNILVGEERAIVTDVAGTTRDILQENINIKGINLNVIDTAGIRDTNDIVEKIGVDKAKKYADEADLIIYVVDTSVSLDESDKKIISMFNGKNVIILLNKSDLESIVDENDIFKMMDEFINDRKNIRMVKTSTKNNLGIDDLEALIEELFLSGIINNKDEIMITNLRHKEALSESYQSLLMVKKSIEDDLPEDFYSIDLMSAYSSLGKIIGEEVEDDLVEEIFSKFCMGK